MKSVVDHNTGFDDDKDCLRYLKNKYVRGICLVPRRGHGGITDHDYGPKLCQCDAKFIFAYISSLEKKIKRLEKQQPKQSRS